MASPSRGSDGDLSWTPIATVSATARTLGGVRAAAGRLLTILRYPTHVTDTPVHAAQTPIVPSVAFEDVHFRYSAERGEVLHGVGFTVQSAESVALVGASGAGKSTCGNLLPRFWDPTRGRVSLAG